MDTDVFLAYEYDFPPYYLNLHGVNSSTLSFTFGSISFSLT